ncbi:E3 SUMO-protein ligase RanBP2-like [Plodia interpunctella]|uniref:E3 SUMO-protein ligase RanBP2-like n=1 Tax=Plodia interpunctella TaxID=58824 RepID=UPI002368AD40|nr:E3 SUMO-protein ligase RanBP2-like [Plodia interpunctella]
MYRNKKDVDKYVENLMSKLSAKEFKTRAYSVARLYFEVGDYSSCKQYVEQYLTQKDNNAAAYKLLGQALQKLGQKEKALEQYKTSLDIDPTQTCTILDICELLADDEITIDLGRAKYWYEKAEATFPRHPVTYKLRERLVTISNPDPAALVSLLTNELAVRPKDALLHARLLKHYLQSNQIKEATDHACNVEFSRNNFLNNYSWYETLIEIIKHNSYNMSDWLNQLFLLTVRERICVLSLTETPSGSSKSLVESNDLLHAYDQAIEAVTKAGASPGFAEFHSSLLQHHRGQLAFHVATYLLKKAKKDQLSWRHATNTASPLMLIAWHVAPLDPKVNWLASGPEKQQQAVQRWYSEGAYRCSQSGHYLLANMKEKNQSILDQISQSCSGTHWRDKLYEKIFTGRGHLAKIKSSYLASDTFVAPTLRLPRRIEVETYDLQAQHQFANSLHHFVWTLLNYKNYAHFKCTLFDMLTPIASTCGPETLNKLDIHAFLYCAALTAGQQKSREVTYLSDKPTVLPANITDLLCSLLQMKWWDCAYKFSQNELGTELTDIRATISRGIEVVRCVDSHGLDLEMLCLLGRIFSEKAKLTTGVDEKTNFEIRAGVYYSSAIPLLEKLKCKIVVKLPEKRMFDYTHKELNTKELIALISESKLFVAVNHLNDCDYDRVIEILSNVKTPQAFYYLSQTYKKIAVEENNTSTDVNETKSKCSALLSKAKNYAYKALDLLKNIETTKDDPLYSDTQLLIEDIETQINKIDPELSGNIGNDPDGKYLSDENISLAVSESIPLRTNSHVFRNLSSTPKQAPNPNATNYRTAVDSHILESTRVDQPYLERIEHEIKNLQKRDTTINDFMEQTKMWFDENRKLGNQIISTIHSNIQNTTDQFKLLKISVDQVKDQIDECRNECKDVGDLKKQIAELKKEVNKLKKASSEQTINESDLYNLEDDYRTNESSSTFAPQLPLPQVIPPFNQRLGLPPFSVPPNPYHLYGQNLYNLYNQYSQFAQAAQVPGTTPLFDPTRTAMNYPGIFPTPEQMYLDVTQLVAPSVPPSTVSTVPPIPPVPSMPSMPSVSTVPPPAPAPIVISKETKETGRTLPVNVVITSSDPLPTCTTTPAPVLSVTIPSKHIKGTTVHNYQITMPSTNETKAMTPPVFSFPANGNKSNNTTASPFASWNQSSMFKNTQSPAVSISNESMLSNTKSFGDGLDTSTTVVDGIFTPNTSLNKSRTLSEKSNTSVENYDPCPDFKPIVPLPAEVKVTTGEEDECTIFSSRAKLFRFVDKQWKERGIGEIKLLKHKTTGKVRVLMRREQVHKICANHIITPEMEIKPMKNETKAYFWVANDFADETVVLEKFCVRFKTADIANEFYEVFEKARKEASTFISTDSGLKSEVSKTDTNQFEAAVKEFASTTSQPTKTVVGGFTFSSTPKFKPVENDNKEDSKSLEPVTSKASIFSGITFKTTTSSPFSGIFGIPNNQTTSSSDKPVSNVDTAKTLNSSDTVEEFEPNVEFKPVIPLPALIEQKTGEEDENVLFEHRAKLLRFDATNKEWKERGLGNIKLLVHKDNVQKVRLLMRREQIMKVCCNHAITKELVFQKMPNMDKAVTWGAKDYSENELVSETFCLRFKTAKLCDDFMEAVQSVQSKMKENPKAIKDEQNAAKQSSQIGFGDKFKPKVGSWYCETCYTNNLEDYLKCACCEQPKPKGADDTKVSSTSTPNTSSWGDSFKPKPGSWECTQCLIRNESNVDICNACNSPKDPSAPKESIKVSSDDTPKFMFGIPQQTSLSIQNAESVAPMESVVPGWGDKFKAKEGSWECKECYVRNEGALDNCGACNNPKDPNAKKQEPKSLFVTSGPKFTFGIPAGTGNDTTPQSQTTSIFDGTGTHKFSFGIPSTGQDKPPTVVSFGDTKSTSIFGTPKSTTENEQPVNFSLKNGESVMSSVATKSALLPTPNINPNPIALGKKEGGTFDFVFKPKTPPKGKSPIKSPKSDKGEESDGNEYASEDEGHHIHFSPVIPMPDKVDVITGEENETELYGHRAKLFRFTAGEWKERGIGVVKILKHNNTNKLRVVMRREQVLKICLNHTLTPDIIYSSKDDKTWLFVANDFSDGELSLHNFCLRFKTKEIALEFKEAIDRARGDDSSEKSHSDAIKKDSSDDVVFVSEIQATKEEKEKAKELKLPENFFTYTNKAPCSGCRGCIEDEDSNISSSNSSIVVGSTVSTTNTTASFSAPAFNKAAISSMSTPTRSSTFSFQSPATSCYGTPNVQDRTSDNSMFRTPLGSIGSNTTTTPSVHNNNVPNNDATNKENTQKLIFSGLGEQKTLFGTPPTTNVFCSTESQTPVSTKTNILAAPKLNTLNTSSEEKQTIDPKSVFGSIKLSDVEPKSIFSSNKPNDIEPKSIFASVQSSNVEPKSIFGSIQQSNAECKPFGFTNTSTSVFGNAGTGTSLNKPIFDFISENKNEGNEKTEIKSLFGSDDQKPFNLFSSANQGGIFGPAALSNNQGKPGSIFGSSVGSSSNSSQTQPFGSGKSIFGLVGDPTAQWTGASFEKKSSDVPAANGSGDKKKEPTSEVPVESPFKVDSNLSFAALSSSNPGGFQKKDNFQWEGAGQQLFGVGQKSANKELEKSKNESGAGEEGLAADEEYDPHYEPIVPLPDKIVVTTGEEDEEKLFGERCKLYRYDEKTREWKERGVGEMKVLYHPGKKSYRLLLRREQVHKAVLNMLLFMDMELRPMKNSDRAWTWAGRNYAETPAGDQEMLAVRFKSVDLATAFHDKVVECVRKLQASAAQAIREQQETNSKPFETVAPLRLPKHMADSARADNVMSAKTAQATAAANFANAGDSKKNGDSAAAVSEIFKQVHFREPQDAREEEEDDEEEGYEDYEHNEDYDGYYNEDDEESSTYYSCDGEVVVKQGDTETVCEHGHVQVLYDQDIYSPKILVTDSVTGEILADMLIYTDTEFQMSGDTCVWSGTDYTSNDPVYKTVTVNFHDSETALLFYDCCETSKAATYTSTDPES